MIASRAPQAWGYISALTINIGDDFQALAAKRFLPEAAIPIGREFVAQFSHPTRVKTVVSGWFMHEKDAPGDLRVAAPDPCWPPAPAIDPFFISIHLTRTFHPNVFAPAHLEYLRAHAPIGARDLYTLEELQRRRIPSYFSGCLTLTLPRHPVTRGDVIYLVDLDERTVAHISRVARSPIAVVSHGKSVLPFLTPEHRLRYAEFQLNLYRRAKCVVTTRLHAALPCLAFDTPVLFLASETAGWTNPRFEGLIEHTWHASKEELYAGAIDFDFDAPPPNPGTHLTLRDRLITAMNDWVGGGSVAGTVVAEAASASADGSVPFDQRTGRAALVRSLIKPGDRGAEIGVQVGSFAYHVLLACSPAALYLIDPWQYGLQADMETDLTPANQAGREAQYREVRALFAPYPHVEVIRAKSQEAVARFADHSLDYVYIDGEHSYDAVLRDLTDYFPKVKIGGVLIGDDYRWTGVARAVDAFLAVRGNSVAMLVDPDSEEGSGQFAIRRLK